MSELISESLPVAGPAACSVSSDAGVYYAQLQVRGHAAPMRVALPGVTSDSQAAQVMESFAGLHGDPPPYPWDPPAVAA